MKLELNILEQTNILRIKSAFTPAECQLVAEEILAYKALNNTDDNSFGPNTNEGCWIGQPHFYNGYSPETELMLVDRIRTACELYYKSLPKPLNISTNEYNITRDEWELWAWANVNDPGSENREHTHTGAFLSGVMYFQATGTGRLEFMPYNYTYKMTLPQWPYYGTSWYEPEDGDIILFPAFLLHKVERNPSDQQRINIAFNATPPPVRGPNARY